MDCTVIAIRHNEDGHKDLALESPVGVKFYALLFHHHDL
jgi:hypothetical protein